MSVVKRGDDDAFFPGSGVDELAVAKIDADMGDWDATFFVCQEKDKISFL